MDNHHLREQASRAVMKTNKFAAHVGNKEDDAERHRDKYDKR